MEDQPLPLIVTIIIQAILIIGAIVRIYAHFEVKIKELEIRLESVERNSDEIFGKLDIIQNMLNEVRLELKDKINR
jgi:hypothetical protein